MAIQQTQTDSSQQPSNPVQTVGNGQSEHVQSDYALLSGAIAQLEKKLESFWRDRTSNLSAPSPAKTTQKEKRPFSFGFGNRGQSASDAIAAPRVAQLKERLCLSDAEAGILLLCAGVELFPQLAQRCGSFHGSEGLCHVSPQLVMAAFDQAGVHALDPEAPLLSWQIVRIGPGPFALSALKLDRAILHFLMGHSYQDPLFAGRLQTVYPAAIEPIPQTYEKLVSEVNRYWLRSHTAFSPIQLCNQDLVTQQQIAQMMMPGMGLALLPASALPIAADELHQFCWHWQRRSFLMAEVLLIDCHGLKSNDTQRLDAIVYLMDNANTPVVLLSGVRLSLSSLPYTVEVPSLDIHEQKALWQTALACPSLPQADWSQALSSLVAQFNLSASAIATVTQRVLTRLSSDEMAQPEAIVEALWETCRSQSRTQLEGFAKRVDPRVTWDDLVLPDDTVTRLRQIIAQVRGRATVYDQWQLGGRSRRGLGITAMFYGLSGTGKTTAAELIAKELSLDLYRVDVSAIVSKYIGETEKNLSKIFAAAETAGAILQFDEADALIGKRSQVKDARDRYANMEVSYLLQRMEAYPGLAILTTNLPDSLDAAFLRRLRFSIEFKAPDFEQRKQIWQRVYGPSVPIDGLSIDHLASVHMTGATIRNIAMSAAFLAAGEDKKINMGHLYLALQAEYRKLKQTMPRDADLWKPESLMTEQEKRYRQSMKSPY